MGRCLGGSSPRCCCDWRWRYVPSTKGGRGSRGQPSGAAALQPSGSAPVAAWLVAALVSPGAAVLAWQKIIHRLTKIRRVVALGLAASVVLAFRALHPLLRLQPPSTCNLQHTSLPAAGGRERPSACQRIQEISFKAIQTNHMSCVASRGRAMSPRRGLMRAQRNTRSTKQETSQMERDKSVSCFASRQHLLRCVC